MRKTNLIILFFSVAVILSFIGSQLENRLGTGTRTSATTENLDKFEQIIEYISAYYVDDVPWDSTVESAIEGLLSQLDPHTVYIGAEEVRQNDENFQGVYQGIGIHYDVLDGYLTIITPIPGSPSDKLGLMAGDRIIRIDGVSAIGIQSSEVPKKLKGPKGTSVDVTVMRSGMNEPLEFTIVRDEIPIFTVNSFFMEADSTGYLSLGRFAKTTEEEIDKALRELDKMGMKRLVLDLRWNAGGYLDQAVKLAARFIAGKQKIVYTESRLNRFNEEYYTDSFGPRTVYPVPLVVMINEASASASEIVAGAIQDYDRGLIVGTTSFGKGLVQREFPLNDESRLRLTISKYYTPSGRLIQRPYKGRNLEQYYSENGDTTVADSDSTTRPVFYTKSGRSVYGGGGITPDISVEYNVPALSSTLTQQLSQKRIYFEVAAEYASTNPGLKNDLENFVYQFEVDRRLLYQLKRLAVERDIAVRDAEFEKYSPYYRNRLKAEIARSLWGSDKYYRVILNNDKQYRKARHLFGEMSAILTNPDQR